MQMKSYARLFSYITKGILWKSYYEYWMYRRKFQRRVTSRCRRGPIVCWRNTSVSGVPRTDLRTGSCNHPRSSSPPSQFTLKFTFQRASFFTHFSLFLLLSYSLFHYVFFYIVCLLRINISRIFFLFSLPFFSSFFTIRATLHCFSFIKAI